MSDIKNCTTCEHSIFSKVWGEYKCKLVGHVVNYPLMECTSHKKREGEQELSKKDFYELDR